MARPRLVEDAALLDAAMFAFWEGGYDGVGTRALEAATGLPASSLYHRFGSKEGLYAAALSHYIERVIQRRIEHYLQQDDVLAGLRGFYTSIYRARGPYRACLFANTWNDPAARQPAIDAVLVAGNERMRAAFTAVVRRGIETGALRAGLVVESAAGFLMTALLGLLTAARIERDPGSLDAQVELVLGALR